jgi:hypothetical protein
MGDADLILAIRAAFSSVPYPGDDDLVTPSYGDEPEETIAAFRGKTSWQALDAPFLDRAAGGSALSFLTPRARQFYLAAYLIADVEGKLTEVDPAVTLYFGLTPLGGAPRLAKVWGGGTIGDAARASYAMYDAGQVAVIVRYLRWKLEADDCSDTISIEQSLEYYWLPRKAEGNA